MSSVARLSIVYATFLIPMRLATNTKRTVQYFVIYSFAYYALLRSGLIDAVL